MKLLLILLLFSLNFASFSQTKRSFKEDSTKQVIYGSFEPQKKFIIGFETAGTCISLRDTITGKMNRQSLIRWEPHFSYYPFKNCGFGITSKIEHFQSNFLADQSTLFEIGLMARAFVPLVVNNTIFKNLSLSFEISLSKANYYYYEKSQHVVYEMNMNQNVLRIPVILSYNLWKNINLRYSFRYLNFLGQYARFESSIGFEYHFLKKK